MHFLEPPTNDKYQTMLSRNSPFTPPYRCKWSKNEQNIFFFPVMQKQFVVSVTAEKIALNLGWWYVSVPDRGEIQVSLCVYVEEHCTYLYVISYTYIRCALLLLWNLTWLTSQHNWIKGKVCKMFERHPSPLSME